jgi:hypothetical protein
MSNKIIRLINIVTVLIVCTFAENANTAQQPAYYPGPNDARLAPRSALLLGISQYNDPMFPKLPNPTNDVQKIGQILESLGFDIWPKIDYVPLTRQKFKTILYDYVRHLKKVGGTSLFYFAGHGLQDANNSYLVPYDGMALYARDLREELIPVDLLTEAFAEAGKDVFHIIILDACRDFSLPSLRNLGETDVQTVKLGIEYDSPDNTFFATSTDKGQRAKDGPAGGLSPYATALAQSLTIPQEPIATTFARVSQYFKTFGIFASDGKRIQRPVATSKGGVAFYFAPTEATFQEEKKLWDGVTTRVNVSPYDYRVFLNGYPVGYFAGTARRLLDQFPAASTIVSAPPSVFTPPSIVAIPVGNIGMLSQPVASVGESQGSLSSVESVRLLYSPESNIPPPSLTAFLDKINLSNVRYVELIARAENEVTQNRVSTAVGRLVRIQSLLTTRGIDPSIVKTTIAGPNDTVPFDEIEVKLTLAPTPRSAMRLRR